MSAELETAVSRWDFWLRQEEYFMVEVPHPRNSIVEKQSRTRKATRLSGRSLARIFSSPAGLRTAGKSARGTRHCLPSSHLASPSFQRFYALPNPALHPVGKQAKQNLSHGGLDREWASSMDAALAKTGRLRPRVSVACKLQASDPSLQFADSPH